MTKLLGRTKKLTKKQREEHAARTPKGPDGYMLHPDQNKGKDLKQKIKLTLVCFLY